MSLFFRRIFYKNTQFRLAIPILSNDFSKGFIKNNSIKLMEAEEMTKNLDWLKLLLQCKDNIRRQITPIIKASKKSQSNLGIGAGGDPIKEIDLVAEKAIIETLKEHITSFTLVSEESGIIEYGENPDKNFLTIDPIDGTTNVIRGIPFFATSIAVSTRPALSTVHTALVADLFHNVTYIAQKGRGSYRDNRRISPSENIPLEEAIIGIDLNTYKAEKIIPKLTRLIKKTKHIRHLGANALEICYVANGTIDAFVDIRGKLRTTDMAAAWLISKEAGAKITSPEGKPLDVKLAPQNKVAFIAANPQIHKIILKTIENPEKEKL